MHSINRGFENYFVSLFFSLLIVMKYGIIKGTVMSKSTKRRGLKVKEKLIGVFEKVYNYCDDVNVYFAPGRVNLIGEHTDYNGGHVFPCALTIGTYAAVRVRDDNIVRMYSENFSEQGIGEISLDEIKHIESPDWCNYPIGILWTFMKKGFKITKGMDIAYYGDIPDGAGLSSSASIEVLTAYILNDIFGFGISKVDLAVLGQYSENHFNMSNCGIMDQFASAMGKADNAIFLDTSTLSYEYAPVKLEGQKLLIINTNKKHKIATSGYNDRRKESEQALSCMQRDLDINSLGELSIEEYEKFKYCIKDTVIKKRAKHAVYENQRTIKAVRALRENDIKTFGELMVQSHISLRDDYEVSCKEADLIVDTAINLDGVWGMRMTGGGFGGCCVGIVDKEKIDYVKETIRKVYLEKVGYEASFYDVSIGDGPKRL